MMYSDFCPLSPDVIADYSKGRKTKLRNWNEYWLFFQYFAELGLNRFRIEGNVPDSIDPHIVLQSIFWRDSFAVFNVGGVWLALPALPGGEYTVYGYPVKVIAYGRNGKIFHVNCVNGEEKLINEGFYNKELPNETGVFIRAKRQISPLAWYADVYAQRAADAMRALDVLRNKAKDPFKIFAREEMKATVERYLQQITDNEQTVITTGVFDPSKVQVAMTPVPSDTLTAMRELVQWYTDQFLEIAGINNNPQSDKRERMIVDEVRANNTQAAMTIQASCDYMNEQLKKLSIISNGEISMEVKPYEPDICGDFGEVSGTDLDELPGGDDGRQDTAD